MSDLKIIVTGTSCTGKTTFGKHLSERLDIPQIDLDDLHFLPNWVARDRSEFIELVNDETAKLDAWIVSGSYQSVLKDSLWKEADIIIWLDLPLSTILGRYFRRTYRRIVFKEKCCGDNYETLHHVLFVDNMLSHIFKTYWSRKKRLKLWRNQTFKDKVWIVPETKSDVQALLDSDLPATLVA